MLDATDDATALEASLAENLERLPMAPFDQYEAFARLLEQGRTVETLAAHFGVTERLIQQRLALANLIEPIKRAAREGQIDAATVQALTLATRKQQKVWWKWFNSSDSYAPTGRNLKAWLCGGTVIARSAALFPLEEYPGQIVTDLFGEESYFADSTACWVAASRVGRAKHRRDAGSTANSDRWRGDAAIGVAVAESLPANGGLLEVIGTLLAIDLRQHWTPDATFFALLRDKEVLKRILSEVGRDPPAKATTAELRAALQRRLDGQGRAPDHRLAPALSGVSARTLHRTARRRQSDGLCPARAAVRHG